MNKNKNKYVSPNVDIIVWEGIDVICTSSVMVKEGTPVFGNSENVTISVSIDSVMNR